MFPSKKSLFTKLAGLPLTVSMIGPFGANSWSQDSHSGQAGSTASSTGITVDSTQWSATDGLGRKLSPVTVPKRDKFVAMFYWTWHQGKDDTNYGIKNISEILKAHPEAIKDANHSAWGTKKPGFFYWEQPLLGYYRTTDPWVLRKHAEMLADAQVDAVFFDCTNGSLTWKESYDALLETWDRAQNDGVNVPKIAFLLPFGPQPHSLESLRKLYRDIYKPGRNQNLWFYWKGKPVIMAYPDNLTDSPEDREIADFFTFRPGQPDYVNGPSRKDHWGWLDNYPQPGYAPKSDGGFEQITVGVAQNAGPLTNGHCSAFNLPGTFARSYSKRKGFDSRPNAYLYGWNFQEQWDRAFEIDPELVFVTGWNEFIAGMWFKEHGWTGEPFSFVDQFDWDRSRDIEPNKGWGDNGDVYYLQLIENVRRFKGGNDSIEVSPPRTISLEMLSDWDDVSPTYNHYRGNTFHRDHPGRYDQYYKNTSGRNDIVSCKVTRDQEYVYFLVSTAEPLSAETDPHWMMLFIDTDRDAGTGWQGYDFIVNRVNPKNGKLIVERNLGGAWDWEVAAEVEYSAKGSQLALKIPRSVLKQVGREIDIEFKWNDNMQEPGNIMDFYVNGDTAPGGRLNFVYSDKTSN